MSRQLATAASGTLRDNHYVLNSVTGLYERSTLLELARTNICLQSQTLDNASWTKTRSSISANADAAPDRTVTADRLIEDSTAANTHFAQQSVTITADASVAFSCFLRAGTRTFGQLRVGNAADTNNFRTTFNLGSGVVGTSVASGTAAHARSGIVALADNWYWCFVVGSIGSGETAVNGRIFICEADNDTTFSGDGASYISLWGAQVENVAAFPTSYITTTTVSVARAADALSYPFTLAPTEMTVYAKFVERGTAFLSQARVLEIGASGSSGVRLFMYQSGSFYALRHISGGDVNSTQAAAPAYGDTVELRGVLSATGAVTLGQSINNATETVAATSAANALGVAWSAENIWLGGVGSGGLEGAIALLSVKIARGTKTMAEMRTLANMDTAVLVLNAGETNAITVQCQSADKMEKEDVGTVSRAFAGGLRVSTRDQKRTFQVVTSYLTFAEEQAIQTLIADNAPIPCSGILLDNDTITCVVKCQRSSLVQGTELWEMSLSLAEV